MILTTIVGVFFLLAFIIFSFIGYKTKSGWKQFVAINSLVVGTNCLKEILPSDYNVTINISRIIIGLIVLAIFTYRDLQKNKSINI